MTTTTHSSNMNKAPQKLSSKTFLLLLMALPVAVAALVVGSLGMIVLLDESGTGSVSRSAFGQNYRRLIAWNPFFSAFFFNGGLIGTVFSIVKMLEHGRAVKAEKGAKGGKDGKEKQQGSTESKKDK